MPQLSDRTVPLPRPDPAEVCGAHQLSTQNILASCRARSPPSLPRPWLCHVTEFGQWGASRREVCRPSSGPSDAPACGTQRGTTTQPSKGMGRSTHTRGPQTVTSTSKEPGGCPAHPAQESASQGGLCRKRFLEAQLGGGIPRDVYNLLCIFPEIWKSYELFLY